MTFGFLVVCTTTSCCAAPSRNGNHACQICIHLLEARVFQHLLGTECLHGERLLAPKVLAVCNPSSRDRAKSTELLHYCKGFVRKKRSVVLIVLQGHNIFQSNRERLVTCAHFDALLCIEFCRFLRRDRIDHGGMEAVDI